MPTRFDDELTRHGSPQSVSSAAAVNQSSRGPGITRSSTSSGRTRPGTVPGRVLPSEPLLHIVPGPRDDWFTVAALETLCSEAWRVSSSSNRVGIRLEGPPLERARHDELLSEGLVTGALQVPASGQPILLMNDHPTTGGYPVIAVVHSDDLWVAGQLAPQQRVRFSLHG